MPWEVAAPGEKRIRLLLRPGERLEILAREREGAPLRPIRLPEGRRLRVVERDGGGGGVYDIEVLDNDSNGGDPD